MLLLKTGEMIPFDPKEVRIEPPYESIFTCRTVFLRNGDTLESRHCDSLDAYPDGILSTNQGGGSLEDYSKILCLFLK